MSILLPFLASITGSWAFLFLFWRRLREDYSATLIFHAAVSLLGAVVFGAFAFGIFARFVSPSRVFDPTQLWFWGAFLGLLAGQKYVTTRFKLKAVETFEASVVGLSVWLSLSYILNFFVSHAQSSLILAAGVLFLLFLFSFLDKRYRSFAWYKSGRLGFSGLFVAGSYFALRVALAAAASGVFSTVGRVDVVLSAIVAFLIYFSLYNLAER